MILTDMQGGSPHNLVDRMKIFLSLVLVEQGPQEEKQPHLQKACYFASILSVLGPAGTIGHFSSLKIHL